MNYKEIQKLKEKIEATRKKLNKMVENGEFTKEETIKLSHELDELLIEYIKKIEDKA